MMIVIIDEFGEVEKKIGPLDMSLCEAIASYARLFDMKCLSYIDGQGDVIFNQEQMKYILLEMETLHKHNFENDLFSVIKKAITYGLTEDYLYMRFEYGV